MDNNIKKTESNNQKLTILVSVLILAMGISFGYYVSKSLVSGSGAAVNATTAIINGARLVISGTDVVFNDKDMLPGHKNITAIKATATGNNEFITYNLIWNATEPSGLSKVDFTVYKSKNEYTDFTTTCTPVTVPSGSTRQLSESCTISNMARLGSPIGTGSIRKGETTAVLATGESLIATEEDNVMYYYIVLEFKDTHTNQSSDMGGSIKGYVTAVEGEVTADLYIATIFSRENASSSWTLRNDVPASGYSLHSSSNCTNEAVPTYSSGSVSVSGITGQGTTCYLYFEKN